MGLNVKDESGRQVFDPPEVLRPELVPSNKKFCEELVDNFPFTTY
jgi:hypothetical protein